MLKLLNFTLFNHVFRVDFAINGILNKTIMWWVYFVVDDLLLCKQDHYHFLPLPFSNSVENKYIMTIWKSFDYILIMRYIFHI